MGMSTGYRTLNNYNTPILYLVFNRPDITQITFEVLRDLKPKYLFVSADGPREGHSDDIQSCDKVKKIIDTVDWDCQLHTLYRKENLGCRQAVSSAISWFFNQVEDGIILEDDCLPNMSFFIFCSELLERYKNDDRVGLISGNNLLFDAHFRNNYSYYFSKYSFIWGWASWRRAFKFYDVNITIWPEIKRDKWLHDIFIKKEKIRHWRTKFDITYNKQLDSWDRQLLFSFLVQSMRCIVPAQNLVSNIGFGKLATHTLDTANVCSNLATKDLSFPLKHPEFILCDEIADEIAYNKIFKKHGIIRSISNRIYRIFNKS
jgi:hypothetical protein